MAVLLGLIGIVVAPSVAHAANTVVVDGINFQNDAFKDLSYQRLDVQWHVEGTATAPLTFSYSFSPTQWQGLPTNSSTVHHVTVMLKIAP